MTTLVKLRPKDTDRGKTIFFVSLGCPKNRVDTERMLGLAADQGLELVEGPETAEIIVINTCGFIGPAKEESIDVTLQMAEQKHQGRCRTLVMAGCLSQRYSANLARELPEVDHFVGTADLPRLADILRDRKMPRLAVGPADNLSEENYERQLIGSNHFAYLKISEGCNRPCSFCSIPGIRGRQRSRTVASLVAEAETLVKSGVRELILVAQDSTAYGQDLGRGADLPTLLRALNDIRALKWIRLHYAYPTMIGDDLVGAMRDLERVVPYLDMPIQHVDDAVLRRMRRGYTGKIVETAINKLRAAIPHLAIRTTMLVGHPGETQSSHEQLLDFIGRMAIDHLGVFPFSPEEETASFTQPDALTIEVAQSRADEVMALQQKVSRDKLASFVGQTIDVMIDGAHQDSEFLLKGRHAGQAPDVDGCVVLTDGTGHKGEIVKARVIDASEYDLVASMEVD
jgi:ribosomal protein S12 methylthiotransferase